MKIYGGGKTSLFSIFFSILVLKGTKYKAYCINCLRVYIFISPETKSAEYY